MPETLKTNGENSVENTEATNHLKVLTEMSGRFDPNKAKKLAEQDKPKNIEEPKEEDKKFEHLAVISEKQEKELSPQDAANEYLSLLDELSQDFSNPYYSDERKGQPHHAKSITTELGLKYSDNPHYRSRGYAGTEAGATDGTMLRIASADSILEDEINWRNIDKKADEEIEKIDNRIADLDANYSKKSIIGKFFGRKKYEEARKGLEQSKQTTKDQLTQNYNGNMAKELAISYNEQGNYDFNSRDYGKAQNEARNRKFFGLDDPERAKKVERAIELREKYEAEWSKKK